MSISPTRRLQNNPLNSSGSSQTLSTHFKATSKSACSESSSASVVQKVRQRLHPSQPIPLPSLPPGRNPRFRVWENKEQRKHAETTANKDTEENKENEGRPGKQNNNSDQGQVKQEKGKGKRERGETKKLGGRVTSHFKLALLCMSRRSKPTAHGTSAGRSCIQVLYSDVGRFVRP